MYITWWRFGKSSVKKNEKWKINHYRFGLIKKRYPLTKIIIYTIILTKIINNDSDKLTTKKYRVWLGSLTSTLEDTSLVLQKHLQQKGASMSSATYWNACWVNIQLSRANCQSYIWLVAGVSLLSVALPLFASLSTVDIHNFSSSVGTQEIFWELNIKT